MIMSTPAKLLRGVGTVVLELDCPGLPSQGLAKRCNLKSVMLTFNWSPRRPSPSSLVSRASGAQTLLLNVTNKEGIEVTCIPKTVGILESVQHPNHTLVKIKKVGAPEGRMNFIDKWP